MKINYRLTSVLFVCCLAISLAMGGCAVRQPEQGTAEPEPQPTPAENAYRQGSLHMAKGESENAYQDLESALKLYRGEQNLEMTAVTLETLALLDIQNKNPRQAVKRLNEALEINTKTGNQERQASTLNNMGKAYSDLGKYKKAIEIFKRSLNAGLASKNKIGAAISLNNIGKAYYKLGKKNLAFKAYLEALNILIDAGDIHRAKLVLKNLEMLQIH